MSLVVKEFEFPGVPPKGQAACSLQASAGCEPERWITDVRVNLRREQRQITKASYTICWESGDGRQDSAQVQATNISDSGLCFRFPLELLPGTVLFIEGQGDRLAGHAVVRHCTSVDVGYRIGVELRQKSEKAARLGDEEIDYYEFLQISPRAEIGTINRIYRFLAGRFHPDNPDTGDPDKFILLTKAFEVLSDPDRRRAYDAARKDREPAPNPAFASIDFMDGVEGEINRRMAVLSLLYNQRRSTPDAPGISVYTIEKRMEFPREYLDFTVWYLRSKKYVAANDNSELELTASGVDYIETNYAKIPVLNKLLLKNGQTTAGAQAEDNAASPRHEPLILGPGNTDGVEWMENSKEDGLRN